MGVVIGILALGFLIFFHELGHFLAARMCGIGVEVFSIGFGRKIFYFSHKNSQFALSLIPLGGYVKLQEKGSCSYKSKPASIKLFVLFAGPFFNFFLGFFLYCVIFMHGIFALTPVIADLQDNSPAKSAGLLPNDRIVSIQNTQIVLWKDIQKALQDYTLANSTDPLHISVKRGAQTLDLYVTPESREFQNIFGEKVIRAFLGVMPSQNREFVSFGFLDSLKRALIKSIESAGFILQGLSKVISGVLGVHEVSGVVGMASALGYTFDEDFLVFVSLCALLSINLGLLNLLPIPMLDGGQILFVLYEMLFKKEANKKVISILGVFGFVCIIGLMCVGLFNDLKRLY